MARMRWTNQRPTNRIKGSKRNRRIAFITLLIFLFLSFQSFILIDKNLTPALMDIAKTKTKQIAADTLNHAIREELAKGIEINKLVEKDKDNEGRVVSANFNSAEYVRIVGDATDLIIESLKKYESENVEISVPLGIATNIAILGNTGPDIPVTIVPKGVPKVTLVPQIQEAAINMILMSIIAHIEIEIEVVVPFRTETISLSVDIPLVSTIFLGEVPQFYYNNSGQQDPSGVVPPVPQIPVPSIPLGR